MPICGKSKGQLSKKRGGQWTGRGVQGVGNPEAMWKKLLSEVMPPLVQSCVSEHVLCCECHVTISTQLQRTSVAFCRELRALCPHGANSHTEGVKAGHATSTHTHPRTHTGTHFIPSFLSQLVNVVCCSQPHRRVSHITLTLSGIRCNAFSLRVTHPWYGVCPSVLMYLGACMR